MTAQVARFGTLADGRAVEAVTLRAGPLSARVLTLGATVQDLRLDGLGHPLVLGFPDLAPYLDARGLYVGALVGRFANRIAGARFPLGGRDCRLDANEGRNHLHGGRDGLHHRLMTIADLAPGRVVLTHVLPEGHMGYPGTLDIRAEISLTGDAIGFDLCARTDAPTPCSLAHHGYFTLDDSGDIRGQRLRIAAGHRLPVDAEGIPTGEIAPVAGTAFDFGTLRTIGAHGYDGNFCLAEARGTLRPVAWLEGRGGLALSVETTEPGLQLYDGRHFGGVAGLDGRRYGPHAGIALETQFWPDAPNRPGFPDAILRPGEDWRAVTRYRFRR